MSDDFLLALQRNFAHLLSAEEQVTLAIDALMGFAWVRLSAFCKARVSGCGE